MSDNNSGVHLTSWHLAATPIPGCCFPFFEVQIPRRHDKGKSVWFPNEIERINEWLCRRAMYFCLLKMFSSTSSGSQSGDVLLNTSLSGRQTFIYISAEKKKPSVRNLVLCHGPGQWWKNSRFHIDIISSTPFKTCSLKWNFSTDAAWWDIALASSSVGSSRVPGILCGDIVTNGPMKPSLSWEMNGRMSEIFRYHYWHIQCKELVQMGVSRYIPVISVPSWRNWR